MTSFQHALGRSKVSRTAEEDLMMELARWLERRFDTAHDVALAPNVLARLRGTPARLEELVATVSSVQAVRRDGDAWSIQENAGHLIDLEALWSRRLEDFLNGVETLTPWDGVNRATYDADYNARVLEDLLREFRVARTTFHERLARLTREDYARTALHPRLRQPMRLIDLCAFVAEHDDHHLARIAELLEGEAGRSS